MRSIDLGCWLSGELEATKGFHTGPIASFCATTAGVICSGSQPFVRDRWCDRDHTGLLRIHAVVADQTD